MKVISFTATTFFLNGLFVKKVRPNKIFVLQRQFFKICLLSFFRLHCSESILAFMQICPTFTAGIYSLVCLVRKSYTKQCQESLFPATFSSDELLSFSKAVELKTSTLIAFRNHLIIMIR